MEESKTYKCDDTCSDEFAAFCYESEDRDNKSPIKLKDDYLKELSSYFKLNNLLNCFREPQDQKHDISISNSIMNCFINKKLGSITYHYDNKTSMKAYHTDEYPEVYYNKKLYKNCNEWIKTEFLKK
jgi:hypothetical protein